jgi:hypothetical protein
MRISKPKPEVSEPKKPEPKEIAVGYQLPTKKTEPIDSLSKASILIHGEKKIGKTSLCAEFPNAIFAAFETGYRGLSVFKEDFDIDPKGWKLFKKFVNSLIKGGHNFENVIIDTSDPCYNACLKYVCDENGWEHPSDGTFGKGWNAVNAEFVEVIDKLLKSNLGVVFLAHTTEREFLERTGGKYDKLIPVMSSQAKSFIGAAADVTMYYGYYGDERLMTIRGSDSVESGHRLKYNFWQKSEALKPYEERDLINGRIHSIPCGNDASETYANLLKAFNNQQKTSGEPTKYEASLTDKKAPMKSKN